MSNIFDDIYKELISEHKEDITPDIFADYFESKTSITISLLQATDYLSMKNTNSKTKPISPIQRYVYNRRENERENILKEIEEAEKKKIISKRRKQKRKFKIPNHGYSDIVTLEELAYTVSDKFDCDYNEALETSEYLLEMLHPNGNILENFLDKETRNMFNILQDAGIVKPIRYETELYDERRWTICLWALNKSSISKPKRSDVYTQTTTKEKSFEVSVYDDLPDEIWKRD